MYEPKGADGYVADATGEEKENETDGALTGAAPHASTAEGADANRGLDAVGQDHLRVPTGS